MASSRGEWAPTTPGEGGPGLGMGRQRGEVYWSGPPARNAGRRAARNETTPPPTTTVAPRTRRAQTAPRPDERHPPLPDTLRANRGTTPSRPARTSPEPGDNTT